MKAIILISGKQGSGKTSVTKYLLEKFNKGNTPYMATEYSFAKEMYVMHNFIRDRFRAHGYEAPEKDGELLQILGDYGRKKYGINVWIEITHRSIKTDEEMIGRNTVFKAASVISDLRFKNEALNFPETLQYRLECPEEIRKARILATPGQSWRENTNHKSEIDLDDYQHFNYIFDSSLWSVEQIGDYIYRDLLESQQKGKSNVAL